MKTEQDFWALVERAGDDECWHWRGGLTATGYGRPMINCRRQGAHRWALIFATGQDHPDMHVLHSCDVPTCCNPAHLRWGTQNDNVADRVRRCRNGARYGSNNPISKLSEASVLEIRASKETTSALAEKYGVTYSAIRAVRMGKTWKRAGTHLGWENKLAPSAVTHGKKRKNLVCQ